MCGSLYLGSRSGGTDAVLGETHAVAITVAGHPLVGIAVGSGVTDLSKDDDPGGTPIDAELPEIKGRNSEVMVKSAATLENKGRSWGPSAMYSWRAQPR